MFALATPKHLDDDENNSQYMYRPVIRITSTEDERVEQFLHDENYEKIDDAKNKFAAEILIKSKTTQLFDCTDENTSDVESFESDSCAISPTDTIRRESILSGESDPIQFECKQSTDPNLFYNREDSSSSYKSNILFERSQSRYSELEYIKGRDDWKDSYLRYDIGEEIDSDNYHHLRRHSETAETLEYIRGREDWLRNHVQRNSLPKIFEFGEPKIVIQDEIDSDEYHHNFFQNETFYSVSVNTGHDKNSSNIAINICDFGESDKVSEAVSSEEIPSVPLANDESNTINETIEDFIIHETANSEDLEITVLDLASTNETKLVYNPFIVISEATDDNEDILVEPNSEQTPHTINRDPTGNTDPSNILDTESIQIENKNQNTYGLPNIMNKFLTSNTLSDTKSLEYEQEMDLKEFEMLKTVEVTQRNNRSIRAQSENTMNQNFLEPNQQPRRSLSFENVEDLIADVSNGPWFHK